jgi:hypothetical protein
MSLFSFFSSSAKYSQERHFISHEEIEHFFRGKHWSSVSEDEEDLVKAGILSARDGNGKISLRRVYEVLKSFEYKHKISPADRKILMRDLESYLNEKFAD